MNNLVTLAIIARTPKNRFRPPIPSIDSAWEWLATTRGPPPSRIPIFHYGPSAHNACHFRGTDSAVLCLVIFRAKRSMISPAVVLLFICGHGRTRAPLMSTPAVPKCPHDEISTPVTDAFFIFHPRGPRLVVKGSSSNLRCTVGCRWAKSWMLRFYQAAVKRWELKCQNSNRVRWFGFYTKQHTVSFKSPLERANVYFSFLIFR